jgi:outer membrane protein
MKKWTLILLLFCGSSLTWAQSKVAHVNSQKLLDTLPSRRDALKKLQDFEANGIKELQEMEADFNKSLAEYEKKAPDLTPMLKKIEEEKLMKKQQNLQERQESLQQEMQIYSQELNKPILERVQKAVEIVSDRKKLNYVLDETVTLYFKGGMDITGEVLVELLKLDAEASNK